MAQARLHHVSAAVVLGIACTFLAVLGWYAIRTRISPGWPLAPVPVVAVSARRFRRHGETGSRLWRLARLYERGIRRVKGDWEDDGATGETFALPGQPYAADLGVVGAGSLFQLLWTGRSSAGQRGLANYLLDAPSAAEIRERQEAIRELRDCVDLREKMALLGPYEASESTWETFAEWLDAPAVRFPMTLRVTLCVTSSLLLLILLACLVAGGTLLPWAWVAASAAPILLFHAAAGLLLRRRITWIKGRLGELSVEIRLLREGLALPERQHFKSAKLKGLAARMRGASRSLRNLDRMLNALHETKKELFSLPSMLLMLPAQLCMGIEQWRAANGAALRLWIDAWAEFEALSSLGCYAYENPDNVFPEICEGECRFEAHGIAHPLLDSAGCVANDVKLNREQRFLIISGSNMSGKSTLLKAIGLNAVLAMAGAPVRALGLRMSRLCVCASISVIDSLATGKSKFLAEIERLRTAIAAASAGNPVLFLVDEILSGTNSRDRRVAAEAVIRTLNDRGALGAITTHDLALTEIAGDARLCGANVHMCSRGNGNPMDFDYTLKSGPTRETNAIAIARMAGVPI